jgi:tRNA 2-selenouridine synthase
LQRVLKSLDIEGWNEFPDTPIIDVRSPGEFHQGHMTSAHSLPLFNDEERAIIGILYKQAGHESAMEKGLEITGPKIHQMVLNAKFIAPAKNIKVHCWRGGMRSGSVAWILNTMGFENVYTLKGGYKKYRNWILSIFENQYPLTILGGKTGSAKTEILKILAQKNEPTIDLEGMANHKGSAFGWIGEDDQPTNEQFENVLGEKLYTLKDQSHIWLEDESEHIGKIRIPHALFEQLRNAKVFFIDIPSKVRIPHLVQTYSQFGDEKLEISLLKIQRRLGGLKTQQALKALEYKDYEQVAEIALYYYDKSYESGVKRRDQSKVTIIPSDTIDPVYNTHLILKAYQDHK